jgi:hypothetical protein
MKKSSTSKQTMQRDIRSAKCKEQGLELKERPKKKGLAVTEAG